MLNPQIRLAHALGLDNVAWQGPRPKSTFLRDCNASFVYAGAPGKRHRKRTV